MINLPIFYDHNIADQSRGTLLQWKSNNYLGGIGTKAGGLGATRQSSIRGLPQGAILSLLYNIFDGKGTSFMYLP